MKPLSGIRVLDLTRALSGPFCTMALADLGADVIKIEPAPKGDMVRQWGPFSEGTSIYYLSANRNKKSLALDFRNPEGLSLLKRLALKSDVIVENFKVGTMKAMGLSYEELSSDNPSLIMASISGFGQTGPASLWPGFDQIAQGYSGLMSLTGDEVSGPMRVGTAVGDMTAGMWLIIGILAAVVERNKTGLGQHVDTSLLAGLIALLSVNGQRYLSLKQVPGGTGNNHPVIAPYGVFEAADGPLNLAPATQEMWEKLCKILKLEHLITDDRFLTNAERMEHRLELKDELEQILKQKTRSDWTKEFIGQGIPAGPINSLDDVFTDPQVVASKLTVKVRHEEIGEFEQVRTPINFSAHQEEFNSMPPPQLGQHSVSVLKEYGFSKDEIEKFVLNQIVLSKDSVSKG